MTVTALGARMRFSLNSAMNDRNIDPGLPIGVVPETVQLETLTEQQARTVRPCYGFFGCGCKAALGEEPISYWQG
jgi:hypothetical protein